MVGNSAQCACVCIYIYIVFFYLIAREVLYMDDAIVNKRKLGFEVSRTCNLLSRVLRGHRGMRSPDADGCYINSGSYQEVWSRKAPADRYGD